MAFLDTGDKIASMVGAVLALAGLWVAVRGGRRRRRGRDPRIDAVRAAQRADAAQHRYRFFGEHVPALTELYVRRRAASGREKARTVQATQLLSAHRHAVLLGDAGAGKSTFLAAVAGDLARRGGREVAVILPAADLVGQPLPRAIAEAVRRDLRVEVPAEVFERAPARGGVWRVLIDGLDEVVDGQDRSDALWRIRELLGGTGPYRLLITSRPLAGAELAELDVAGTGVYELRPFDRQELNEFAHRWFAARFPSDRRRADSTAGRFLARLAGARLGPVARVPLLATIAALVYEQADDRALPSSRAELYERFVQHLLDGRGSMARFRAAIEPQLLDRGRAGLAAAEWLFADLHQHVGGLLRACGAAWLADRDARLTEVAATWFRANGPADLARITPDADRLLRELLLATGVCALRGDRVVFLHQSFAEYLAAASGIPFDRDTWLAQAADPVTRSLAAFVVARRPDSDDLVATLDPIAAGDLIADGVPVSPRTRSRTVDRLVQEVAAETPQAPEALRILGELSLDAQVLGEMLALYQRPDVSAWVRAMVADRIADVDPATGVKLLEEVAATADDVVQDWIADVLQERGLPEPPVTHHTERPQALGALARHALTRRIADSRATEHQRAAAARQLARAGDRTALRAMAAAADVGPFQRVELAVSLADTGEPELLRELGAGAADTAPARYAAAVALADRDDPAAVAALAEVARAHPGYPMAFAAAARCADLGDREPLLALARQPGQVHVRLAAARRLAALGDRRALGWLLEDRLSPELEALALAGLLEAGQAEQMPRMRALRTRHLSGDREREREFLLAANGDEASRERLHRRMLRGSRWWQQTDAAIALAAIGDERGASWLRRVAGDPRWYRPARVRAAVGLTWLDPVRGRPVLHALTGPGVEPRLRLAAAKAALTVEPPAVEPLAGIALDDQAPDRSRAAALTTLTRLRLAPDLRLRLGELALTGDTPMPVRLAAAPLLPEERFRAVVGPIATGDPDRRTRLAAIEQLDHVDRQAAEAAFGALLRDRRINRLRRWVLTLNSGELLSAADARTLDDRLGEPDLGLVRFLLRLSRLLPRDPADVFEG